MDDAAARAARVAAAGAVGIGEWVLVPSTHALERHDGRSGPAEEKRLPRQLVALLWVLASRPGATWSREELLQRVWTRKVVNDEVLSRAIADLRAHLGDDARAPRYIETLPKTGYRLIAPVRPLAAAPAAGPDASVPAPLPGPAAAADDSGSGSGAAAGQARRAALATRVRSAALLLALAAALAWWLHDPSSNSTGAGQSVPWAAAWSAERLLGQQPFRSGPDWAHQPRFSADGRWLAYVVTALQDGSTTLWWSAADGSGPRPIDAGPGRLATPVFSPDGSALAFTSARQPSAQAPGACVVRVLVLPAGVPRDLAPCAAGQDAGLDWPQVGRLLYGGPPVAAGRGSALWQVDPRSGERQALTDPPVLAVADTSPRTAADGRIAFLRGPPLERAVWLRHEGREWRLGSGGNRIGGLAWTPAGDALLVATDQGGFPALQVLDAATGNMRLLGGRGAATLDVAPDGRLLYEQRRYDANLWMYADDLAPLRLTASTRYEAFAALSGAADRVLYASNSDGNQSVWLQELSGEDARRLPLDPARTWARPQWLDQRQVLLTRYMAAGGTHIEVFDLASQRLLARHPLQGPGFAALPLPGERLLLAQDTAAPAAGMQLVVRGAGGDQPLPEATGVAEFRTDGRWIGWTSRADSLLRLSEVDPPRSPPRALALDLGQAWTLHRGDLVTARHDARGWALWRQALPDGAARRWLPLRARVADGQLAIATQGAQVVVSHLDAFASDLLLVPAPPVHDQAEPGT